jgi:hypothetical protein
VTISFPRTLLHEVRLYPIYRFYPKDQERSRNPPYAAMATDINFMVKLLLRVHNFTMRLLQYRALGTYTTSYSYFPVFRMEISVMKVHAPVKGKVKLSLCLTY